MPENDNASAAPLSEGRRVVHAPRRGQALLGAGTVLRAVCIRGVVTALYSVAWDSGKVSHCFGADLAPLQEREVS